jgi:hypothetical protein
MQKLDFSSKYYFAVFLFKVSAWLSHHAVCKIGLSACSEYSKDFKRILIIRLTVVALAQHAPMSLSACSAISIP